MIARRDLGVRLALIATAGLVLVSAIWWFYLAYIRPMVYLTHPTGGGDFELNAALLNGIVNDVQRTGVWAGADRTPRVLRGHPVWAKKEQDGSLTVSVQLYDHGHAGLFGYLYTAGAPRPANGDPYHPWDVPGDLPFIGDRVADRWWEAYNNLQ